MKDHKLAHPTLKKPKKSSNIWMPTAMATSPRRKERKLSLNIALPMPVSAHHLTRISGIKPEKSSLWLMPIIMARSQKLKPKQLIKHIAHPMINERLVL